MSTAAAIPVESTGRLLGSWSEFRRSGPDLMVRLQRQYGDVVRLRIGPQTVTLISDPEMVRDILVTHQFDFKKSRMLERAKNLLGEGLLTSEGDHHKQQRRLVQPAFHRERLAGYATSMAACAEKVRDRWREGEEFDVTKEMMRLTLDIVGRCLFSADVEGEAAEIGHALTQVFDLFDVIMLPFSEYLEKLPLPAVRRFHQARARLDETIYRLIRECRASGEDRGDLLSMLLLARDEDGKGGMSDEQARDEALTLFIAGHETTAVAMSWTWYLLAQHPEKVAALQAELREVLSGRTPTFNDLPRLKYAEAVFMEGLRLYPPAWAIGRRALKDFAAGPYTIPAQSVILVCPWVIQRDPRWYPDPEEFRPERWLADDATRPKFAYFPFGGGTRVCIGERFAWMEGTLLLATLAQRWNLALVPGQKIETLARITLRAKHGIRMRASRANGGAN